MKWNVKRDLNSWDKVFEEIQEMEIIKKISESSRRKLFMCLEESASNIIIHSDEEAFDNFSVIVKSECQYIEVVFQDKGTPFNPLTVCSPEIIEKGKKNKAGGFGIYMMKQMADKLSYEYSEGINILKIRIMENIKDL